MKYILFFIFPLFLCGCFGKNTLIEKQPVIRICLSQTINKVNIIEIAGSYKIFDDRGKLLQEGERLNATKITGKEESIWIQEKKYPTEHIIIKSLKDIPIQVNENFYRGEIFCVIGNKSFQIINIVPMEAYISSVLGSEMKLSWPEASLEAQAIIARTYAYHEKVTQKKPHFDLYDSTSSQVYKGIKTESEKSQSIVQRTKGMVLLYQNALFKTFFHSTCGGYTANAKSVFDYHDIAPLAGRKCPFCEASPYFSWTHTASRASLEAFAKSMNAPLPLQKLSIEKIDPGKRVLSIKLLSADSQSRSIKASELRNYLGSNKLRSTLFTMESTEEGILFQGKGWGHGVGLCQYGAKVMGEKGYSSLDILNFYYPCTQIYRLWK